MGEVYKRIGYWLAGIIVLVVIVNVISSNVSIQYILGTINPKTPVYDKFLVPAIIQISSSIPVLIKEQIPSQEIHSNNKNNNYFAYGIKITSPVPNQNVPANSKTELIVSGTSSAPELTTTRISDNNEVGRKGCQVFVILNDIQPYQKAIPTGRNGINDYSTWQFKIIPSDHYQINEGLNRITAKLSCAAANNDTPESVYDIRWNSVNINGVSQSK
jgi:hypothetical protein